MSVYRTIGPLVLRIKVELNLGSFAFLWVVKTTNYENVILIISFLVCLFFLHQNGSFSLLSVSFNYGNKEIHLHV